LKKTGNSIKLKKVFVGVLLLAAFLPAMGFCFEVTAHVDKTRISREDSVFLTIEVKGGKADVELSAIKDFKIISRGSSSSYNFINGKSERKATYQYALIPLAEGTLKIPAIKVVKDGQTAYTRQILIQVSERVANGDDVKSLFARADVTKTPLFVGEQAVYTLKFFTSKRLSGLGFERPPEFIGFSSKPFEKEKNYSLNIKGIRYNVTQVSYVIIPEKPGTFTIDPAVLVANVIMKSRRSTGFDSFFNDSFFSPNSYKPARIVSNPVKIEVLPVPSYQGKGEFSGLVGRFDIEGNVDKTRLKAGESVTLTIKISGLGNIMDAGLPKIDLQGDTLKIYDDNPVETIHLTENGFEGFKLFKKAIVPVHPGQYQINPVSLIYFDVDQKDFKTVSTKLINLDVLPSEKIQVVTNIPGQTKDRRVNKKEVSLVNKDILDIKEGLAVLKDYRQIDPFSFLLFLFLPAVFFSGAKLFVMVSKRDISIERQMEEKSRYHLKQALKMNTGDSGFLGHLYSSVAALILAKDKKKGEVVTLEEARSILSRTGMDDMKIKEITGLLDVIESIRFGGKKIDENKAQALLLKTKKVIKLFCIALACMGLFSFVPQKAMADTTSVFVEGVKAYKAGDFTAAAEKFEGLAKRNIKNPYLFYNIANAYLKANDIGRAILWYERAKVLAPNDPDLIFNLDHANTLVKDKKETAVNLMDVLFFWDNMIPPKTIQIAAVFLSSLFFIWAGVRVIKKQKVLSGIGIFLCACFVFVTTIAGINYYQQAVRSSAVIIEKEVSVHSGMTETSTKLFTLHAGTKVRVEEVRSGYVKIVFSKGKIGWVKADQAAII